MSFVVATPPVARKVTTTTHGTSQTHSFVETIASKLTNIHPDVSDNVKNEIEKLLGLLSMEETIKAAIKHHDYTYLAAAAWLVIESPLYQGYRQAINAMNEYKVPNVHTVKDQAVQIMAQLREGLLPQLINGIARSLTKDTKDTVLENVALTLFQELCYLLSLLQSISNP